MNLTSLKNALLCLVLAAASLAGAEPILSAKRHGGFAASPWLDASVEFHLEEAGEATARFWIEVMPPTPADTLTVPGSEREITAALDAGSHRLGLGDNGQYIWLLNLEPMFGYRLAGELETPTGEQKLGPIPISPPALSEISPPPIDPSPGKLYRVRYTLGGKSFVPAETRPFRLLAAPERPGEAPFLSALRVATHPVSNSLAGPPVRGNGYRDYDVYISLPESFEAGGEIWQGMQSAGEGQYLPLLHQVGWSAINPDKLTWLKSMEWRFNSSPYSTGWEPMEEESESGSVTAYWSTGLTKKLADQIRIDEASPGIPRRIHRLRVESRNAKGLRGGWRLVNLFRAPESDEERRSPGRDSPEKARDLANRLLRFDVILSANVPGDQIPRLRFAVESNGFAHEYEVRKLSRQDGTILPTGEFTRESFYIAPPHNQLTQSGEEALKTLNFQFETIGHGNGEAAVKQVNLENLTVWETLIADLPSGPGYETLSIKQDLERSEEPWPAASMLQVKPGSEITTIKPLAPECGSEPKETEGYYLADHAVFQDDEARWHLYGIFNSLEGFTPLNEEGRSLANGPYMAGLIHAQACRAGAPFDAQASAGRADWKGAAFTGEERRTEDVFVDFDQPLFFFGPWAPSIIRVGREFVMFYTEHALNHPAKRRGFGYATTSSPGDSSSWKPWKPVVPEHRLVYTETQANRARDISIERRKSDEGGATRDFFHAVWTGYKAELAGAADEGTGKVLHKQAAEDPRLLYDVPKDEEYIVYNEHNADSGRIDSESESPSLIYDPATEIFYLKVTKNGTTYPGHAFENDLFVLDRERGALIHGEMLQGDRSDLITGFRNPAGFAVLEPFVWEPSRVFGQGTFRYRYRLVVAERGDEEKGAGLLEVNCLTGEKTPFAGAGPGAGHLEAPTDVLRLNAIHIDDQRQLGLIIADEGKNGEGFLHAAWTPWDETSKADNGRILEGLDRPRALFSTTTGLTGASALFGSPERENVFRVEATHKGLYATPHNGEIIVRIQHPGEPNAELQASFFTYYPDLIASVTVATDLHGDPTSTVAQVVRALYEHPVGQINLKASTQKIYADQVASIERQRLTGGQEARTLYFASGSGAESTIQALNITDLRDPGEPWLIARADFSWDPAGIVIQGEKLFLLDAESGSIYQGDLSEGPLTISRDQVVASGLEGAASFSVQDDKIFINKAGGVARFDPATGEVQSILSQDIGDGTPLSRPVDSVNLSFVVEGIDAGVKVYWSRQDPESGRLLPFTADRYIGYLPHYASELSRDSNQPGAPWFASFTRTSADGGYGIRRVEWMPEIGGGQ